MRLGTSRSAVDLRRAQKDAHKYVTLRRKQVLTAGSHEWKRRTCDECQLCCHVMDSADNPETVGYTDCALQCDEGCSAHRSGKPLACKNFFCGYRMELTEFHPKDCGFYVELSQESFGALCAMVGAVKSGSLVVHFKGALPDQAKIRRTPALREVRKLTAAMALLGNLVVWRGTTEVRFFGPKEQDGRSARRDPEHAVTGEDKIILPPE